MFYYTHRKKSSERKKTGKTASETVQDLSGLIMDFVICIYLLLIFAVLPFYYRDGYAHIATDKATLFRRVSICFFQVILPIFAIYLGAALAGFLRKVKMGKERPISLEQLRKYLRGFTRTEKFIGLYGLALILSYLCSNYREEALWGAGNGWYTGFLPQLMLLGACLLVGRFWRPRKLFWGLLFGVSAVVFLLGYLNRFAIYPIKMNMSSPDFISTIGNINWFCGYVVITLFAGIAMLWQGESRPLQRTLLSAYVLLGFGTLVTQGSDSGIFALAVMLLILFGMSAGSGERMWSFWLIVCLLSIACLATSLLRCLAPNRMNYGEGITSRLTAGGPPIIMTAVSFAAFAFFYIILKKEIYWPKAMKICVKLFLILVSCFAAALVLMITVNTIRPGSLGGLSEYDVFTFSDSWGSNRGATWKAGVMCFREQNILHKLTGVGPDAMAAYCYGDGSGKLQSMLNNQFGENTRLTNAHNEWLTVLVNTGIIGLIGFGGMMASAIQAFLKRTEESDTCLSCTACGLALLAYTINNIFSFQQTVSLSTMMMILGMGMAFRREKQTKPDPSRL